jgi:hypothetical protein
MERRNLLIGGVGLVPGNLRSVGPVLADVCNNLEPILIETRYLREAPFKTISVVFRFGDQADRTPEYAAIDRHHEELPVAIYFRMDEARRAKRHELRNAIELATLNMLVDIGKRYRLPIEQIENRRFKLLGEFN